MVETYSPSNGGRRITTKLPNKTLHQKWINKSNKIVLIPRVWEALEHLCLTSNPNLVSYCVGQLYGLYKLGLYFSSESVGTRHLLLTVFRVKMRKFLFTCVRLRKWRLEHLSWWEMLSLKRQAAVLWRGSRGGRLRITDSLSSQRRPKWCYQP